MNKNAFSLIFILIILFSSCSKTDGEFENPSDFWNPEFIIGTWMDKEFKIYSTDQNGNKVIISNGTITFNADNSYKFDDWHFWLGLYEGHWIYNERTHILDFQQNYPKEIDGIPIIEAEGWEVERNWEILHLDNSVMKVKEHQFRAEKIITSPITQKKDTIQGIDFFITRNLSRVE